MKLLSFSFLIITSRNAAIAVALVCGYSEGDETYNVMYATKGCNGGCRYMAFSGSSHQAVLIRIS
jgi:hypothetical protein